MNTITPILISAVKRAKSLGKYHSFSPEFNSHPLAACITNYMDCIQAEMEDTRNLQHLLYFYFQICDRINNYCENNKVMSDNGAEYWLEIFVHFRERMFLKSLFLYEYVDMYNAVGQKDSDVLEFGYL